MASYKIEAPCLRETEAYNMSSPTRNIHNLRDYIPTPFAATLQIDNHPAIPIVLTADRNSWQPLVHTQGKVFGSVEHLFHHYNKYIAGYTLNRKKYLENHCQRLLSYIVFQSGPYNQLSAAQTLELSPAEWAEMPELEEDTPVEQVATAVPLSVEPVVPQPVKTDATTQRMVDLRDRCDAIERVLVNQYNETNDHVERIYGILKNINKSIMTLHTIINTVQNTVHTIKNTQIGVSSE